MPTTYSDQFFVMDPGNPPASGTSLTVQTFDYIDQNDDGIISTSDGDTFNGLTINRVWVNDTITVNIPGQGDVTISGVTFYTAGGPAVFTPNDGTILQDATFISSTFVTTSSQVSVDTLAPTCFAAGTMIATPDGPKSVESIACGDLVLTRDHGPQPVLMVCRDRFAAHGRNAPVRICKGALGNDEDLLVSQQHRMLIGDWRAEFYFGEPEVLVAAKHLVNGDTIYVQHGGMIDYVHLLFARHEIVWAAGVPSESYFPQAFVARADSATQDELERLFPDIQTMPLSESEIAYPEIRRYESAVLLA